MILCSVLFLLGITSMGTVSSALPLTGIIRVDTGKKGANQVLYVFQVGEVDEKSPSLDFTLRPEYESSGIYLQDIKEIHAETIQALEKCVNLENADAEIVLDSEGKGEISVTPGVYLITQKEQGRQDIKIQSSLIFFPNMNTEQTGWNTEVEVNPKVSVSERPSNPPQTGDDRNVLLWGILLIGSLTGTVLLVIGKRGKRREEGESS